MRRVRLGFTLLELTTVVSVIGVLAAVAVPSFISQILGAKSAQAQVLLHAVAHRIEVAQEEGRPVEICAPAPTAIPKEAVFFEPTPCWRRLGFAPTFPVYYQLAMIRQPDGRIRLTATGDLDGDGEAQVFTLDNGDTVPHRIRGRW